MGQMKQHHWPYSFPVMGKENYEAYSEAMFATRFISTYMLQIMGLNVPFTSYQKAVKAGIVFG